MSFEDPAYAKLRPRTKRQYLENLLISYQIIDLLQERITTFVIGGGMSHNTFYYKVENGIITALHGYIENKEVVSFIDEMVKLVLEKKHIVDGCLSQCSL